MTLKQFLDQAKLDFADITFNSEANQTIGSLSELRPDDFITFAKADFFKADVRGLVNALSNAKRAMDCQADNFIAALGLDSDRISEQLGVPGMACLKRGSRVTNAPLKYKLLSALGLATPELISRIREARNLLEHDYKKPSRKVVSQ